MQHTESLFLRRCVHRKGHAEADHGVMLPMLELCAIGGEHVCFFEKYCPKIEVPAPRRARYDPASLNYKKHITIK